MISSLRPQEEVPTSVSLCRSSHDLHNKLLKMITTDTPIAATLSGLQGLPPELRELVFTFMLQSPGGHILFRTEVLNVLEKLVAWPDNPQYSTSCNQRLFTRWETQGTNRYLAGLYSEAHEGVGELVANDQNWDLIVIRSDDFGIVCIELSNSKLTYAIEDQEYSIQILRVPDRAHEEIWIRLEVRSFRHLIVMADIIKGLFVSRIDLQRETTRRIKWRSSAPLPLNDLPAACHQTSDLAAEYSSFEGIRGISVAHSGRNMVAIYTHTSNNDNDPIYHLEHADVTWGYCPIEVNEPIETIWLVNYSCEGSGLVVCIRTLWFLLFH